MSSMEFLPLEERSMPSVGQDMPATREVSRCRSRSFVARRELTTALDDSLRNAADSEQTTTIFYRKKDIVRAEIVCFGQIFGC